MRALALLVAAALAQAPAMTLTTIAKGDASGQQIARQVVARTAAEWQALWKAHAPEQPLPAVDFTTHMVVGVFLGSKPSAGWSVEIVGARAGEKELLVEYTTRQPATGTFTAQILTEPYHLAAVPQHAGPVRFREGVRP